MNTHALKYPSAVGIHSRVLKSIRGDFESTVAGIPCRIEITYFNQVKGDPTTWSSDWDYYGYTEIEFDVLDRRGRPAPWLERKLTDAMKLAINEEIEEFMGGDE